MIKHKKIIISLLLAYAFFIVGIFDVKALDLTDLQDMTPISLGSGSFVSETKYGNVDRPLVLTNTKTTSFGDNGPDYLVLTGYNALIASVGNNNYIPINYFDYSRVTINTSDGKEYLCENHFDNGYAICSNPRKTITSITLQVVVTASENSTNYYWRSAIYASCYWANYRDSNSQIAQNTSDINNKISDSSIDTNNTDSSVSGFSSSTNSSMSNTPVSSMISLPITFLTGVNNALSSSCTNVNYIELFNYQLVLPCLNLSDRLGSVWTIIDTIFSCMLIFSIGKSLVSTFARLSDMDTNIMYECYANGTKHRGESFDD